VPTVTTWQNIADQGRARDAFARTLAADRMPHAYILTGGSAHVRRDVILAIASAINCPVALQQQPPSADACGRCESCEKFARGTHPDFHVLTGTGASGQVAIETVRDMIVRLALLPNEAQVRVIAVHEATALAGPAANALLKTLEEPPARTLFVLATAAPDQLLPTIKSRCQRLRLAGREDEPSNEDSARINALAERILAFCNDARDPTEAVEPASDLAAAVAEKVGETKNAHLLVIEATAERLADRARAAALQHDTAAARRDARRATAALQWHFSMRVHNAHPVLATETLLGELRDPL